MAVDTILDLLDLKIDHPHRVLGGIYLCAKFGSDQCSTFDIDNIMFLIIILSIWLENAYPTPKGWDFMAFNPPPPPYVSLDMYKNMSYDCETQHNSSAARSTRTK